MCNKTQNRKNWLMIWQKCWVQNENKKWKNQNEIVREWNMSDKNNFILDKNYWQILVRLRQIVVTFRTKKWHVLKSCYILEKRYKLLEKKKKKILVENCYIKKKKVTFWTKSSWFWLTLVLFWTKSYYISTKSCYILDKPS